MPIHSTPVRSVLALAGALLGGAPTAGRLVARTGHPIPYRVGLPEGAQIDQAEGLLSARTQRGVGVVVVARDMLQREGSPLPGAGAESRRRMTDIVMGSDKVLFAVLEEELRGRTLELSDVVRGTGTLGGQRAACVQGRLDERGAAAWIDIHGTVRDGVLYVLAFTVRGRNPAQCKPLLARIRESFVLPR